MNAPVRVDETASMPMSVRGDAITFAGVGKVFAARRGGTSVSALTDVSLTVGKGEIFGIIGRSGAGKSTLIRLVNGLEVPSSGSVTVAGTSLADLSAARLRTLRRGVGMIFQHFNLLSSRTAYDNVALPLEIAGADRATIRAKVDPLLALVGLADKRDRYPAELSGGQKQRVGIARALATDPGVLLCDEATSALDPETTQSILALLARINRERGITILLITHEIPVIKEICHRVAVMEAGRIIEEGRVFDVLTRPRHPTTASFVKAVTGVELPADIAARLGSDPVAGGSAILRITFTGRNASAPVLSRITSVLGIDVNLLAGRIDSIAGEPFGALLVSVPAAEPARRATLTALSALSLESEVVGYVA